MSDTDIKPQLLSLLPKEGKLHIRDFAKKIRAALDKELPEDHPARDYFSKIDENSLTYKLFKELGDLTSTSKYLQKIDEANKENEPLNEISIGDIENFAKNYGNKDGKITSEDFAESKEPNPTALISDIKTLLLKREGYQEKSKDKLVDKHGYETLVKIGDKIATGIYKNDKDHITTMWVFTFEKDWVLTKVNAKHEYMQLPDGKIICSGCKGRVIPLINGNVVHFKTSPKGKAECAYMTPKNGEEAYIDLDADRDDVFKVADNGLLKNLLDEDCTGAILASNVFVKATLDKEGYIKKLFAIGIGEKNYREVTLPKDEKLKLDERGFLISDKQKDPLVLHLVENKYELGKLSDIPIVEKGNEKYVVINKKLCRLYETKDGLYYVNYEDKYLPYDKNAFYKEHQLYKANDGLYRSKLWGSEHKVILAGDRLVYSYDETSGWWKFEDGTKYILLEKGNEETNVPDLEGGFEKDDSPKKYKTIKGKWCPVKLRTVNDRSGYWFTEDKYPDEKSKWQPYCVDALLSQDEGKKGFSKNGNVYTLAGSSILWATTDSKIIITKKNSYEATVKIYSFREYNLLRGDDETNFSFIRGVKKY